MAMCLLLAMQGKSDWDIGQILGLSPETVNQHFDMARSRFGVAYENGITDENLHVTERFTRTDAETILYQATVDDPAVFTQVHVGERGRSLEWPGEIDFCADALWFEIHPAGAPQHANPL